MMPADPLDYFHNLATPSAPDEPDAESFPGGTSPKNRGESVDSPGFEWLNDLPHKEFLVKGEPRRFYTIGALAEAMNRSTVTIRSWEQKGWLPPANYRTPPPVRGTLPDKAVKGNRLYSKDQIKFLVEANERFIEATPPNWAGFKSHIKRQYPTT